MNEWLTETGFEIQEIIATAEPSEVAVIVIIILAIILWRI